MCLKYILSIYLQSRTSIDLSLGPLICTLQTFAHITNRIKGSDGGQAKHIRDRENEVSVFKEQHELRDFFWFRKKQRHRENTIGEFIGYTTHWITRTHTITHYLALQHVAAFSTVLLSVQIQRLTPHLSENRCITQFVHHQPLQKEQVTAAGICFYAV